MATKSVRVEFICVNEPSNRKLQFTGNVPRQLVDSAQASPFQTQHDALFQLSARNAMTPIVAEHYQETLQATMPRCCICDVPRTRAFPTPMSYLHVSDPFIVVHVMPACDKPICGTQIQQNSQSMMLALMNAAPSLPRSDKVGHKFAKETIQIMPCQVCHTTEKTFACGRCRVAFYCGKEHQKVDWPSHKAGCKAPAQGQWSPPTA